VATAMPVMASTVAAVVMRVAMFYRR
jgi:hypothetical protein